MLAIKKFKQKREKMNRNKNLITLFLRISMTEKLHT